MHKHQQPQVRLKVYKPIQGLLHIPCLKKLGSGGQIFVWFLAFMKALVILQCDRISLKKMDINSDVFDVSWQVCFQIAFRGEVVKRGPCMCRAKGYIGTCMKG